jgi:hypothetical protein
MPPFGQVSYAPPREDKHERDNQGGNDMAQSHDPEPAEPMDRGSVTGFAAIKYPAIIIIVLAILAFLAWVIIRFTS